MNFLKICLVVGSLVLVSTSGFAQKKDANLEAEISSAPPPKTKFAKTTLEVARKACADNPNKLSENDIERCAHYMVKHSQK